MPLRDRFRRAINRSSDRSTSSSGSSTNTNNPSTAPSNLSTPIQTPNPNGTSNNPITLTTTQSASPPKLTLTKTRSGLSLNLTKTLTFRSKLSQEEKEKKKIEKWEKMDEQEWTQPSRAPGKRKSKAHQDLLRSFELNFKRGSLDVDRRKDSGWSGVSPGQSRVGSVASPKTESGPGRREMEGLERVMTGGGKRSSSARPLGRSDAITA